MSAPTVSQVLPGSTTVGYISPCLRHRSLLVALGLQKMAHCITTARPREGPHSAVLSDILWANEKHQEAKLNTKENIYCLATAGHYEKGNIHLPQAAKCHPPQMEEVRGRDLSTSTYSNVHAPSVSLGPAIIVSGSSATFCSPSLPPNDPSLQMWQPSTPTPGRTYARQAAPPVLMPMPDAEMMYFSVHRVSPNRLNAVQS